MCRHWDSRRTIAHGKVCGGRPPCCWWINRRCTTSAVFLPFHLVMFGVLFVRYALHHLLGSVKGRYWPALSLPFLSWRFLQLDASLAWCYVPFRFYCHNFFQLRPSCFLEPPVTTSYGQLGQNCAARWRRWPPCGPWLVSYGTAQNFWLVSWLVGSLL